MDLYSAALDYCSPWAEVAAPALRPQYPESREAAGGVALLEAPVVLEGYLAVAVAATAR
jgi:hypothetical protein